MNLERATALIAGFEGFRGFVYDDSTFPSQAVTQEQCDLVGGQWKVRHKPGATATVGYGETSAAIVSRFWDSGITEPDARILLAVRVAEFGEAVHRSVPARLSDHQHEAATSLAFNIGTGAFASSTVRQRLNAGDPRGAADAFRKFVKPAALAARREAEIAHFLTPDTTLGKAGPMFLVGLERANRTDNGYYLVLGSGQRVEIEHPDDLDALRAVGVPDMGIAKGAWVELVPVLR
ncbi:MAG: lysozyme [Acidimicrobiia bacterium]